jgi:hypothetical protein
MSLWDDVVDAVEGALDTLSDVVSAIADAVKSGAKIAGTVLAPVGDAIKYVVNGVAYELGDLVGIHMRSLTQAERDVLRNVFQGSLPVDKILVTSIPGKDGRAFTIPGSMVVALAPIIPVIGPLITLAGLIEDLQDKYLINVGSQYGSLLPSSYDFQTMERSGSLLVHESTHVWQGIHSAFSWWYVFNSLYSQYKCGQHAYDVDEAHLTTWSDYGVEQQAHLVENWYSRGSKTTDTNYPFIRDNIRPGKPSAKTVFPVTINSAVAGRASSAATSAVAPPPPPPGSSTVIGRAATAVVRPSVGRMR